MNHVFQLRMFWVHLYDDFYLVFSMCTLSVCLGMCVYHMCAVSSEARRGLWIPQSWTYGCWIPSTWSSRWLWAATRFWELILDPLEERSAFLTTELSLQLLNALFLDSYRTDSVADIFYCCLKHHFKKIMNWQPVVTRSYMVPVAISLWLVIYVGFFFFHWKNLNWPLHTVKFSELTCTVCVVTETCSRIVWPQLQYTESSRCF